MGTSSQNNVTLNNNCTKKGSIYSPSLVKTDTLVSLILVVKLCTTKLNPWIETFRKTKIRNTFPIII